MNMFKNRHSAIISKIQRTFEENGYEVDVRVPLPSEAMLVHFIDLYAHKEDERILVEVKTSPVISRMQLSDYSDLIDRKIDGNKAKLYIIYDGQTEERMKKIAHESSIELQSLNEFCENLAMPQRNNDSDL